MNKGGRRSAASLEVAKHAAVTEIKRPEPLQSLTSEEAAEWKLLVNDLPADWFRDSNISLLENYVRCVVHCRRLAEMINQLLGSDGFSVAEYDRLLKMQETQHRALLSFATKMRLTQQATYDKERSKKRPLSKPPWTT